jgi:hypothetical protein
MTLEPPTGGGEDGDAIGVAMTFLEDELTAAGRLEASVLVASARRAGISEATLKRARGFRSKMTPRRARLCDAEGRLAPSEIGGTNREHSPISRLELVQQVESLDIAAIGLRVSTIICFEVSSRHTTGRSESRGR